jgi:hypothetical protein
MDSVHRTFLCSKPSLREELENQGGCRVTSSDDLQAIITADARLRNSNPPKAMVV